MQNTQGATPALNQNYRLDRSTPTTIQRGSVASPLPTYLRLTQLVEEVVPVSRATIWRWVKSGEFPAPIKLAERVTAWKLTDVLTWLESRATA